MKKFVLVTTFALAFCFSASANINGLNNCTTNTVSLAFLQAQPGGGCEQGDKAFYNFALSGPGLTSASTVFSFSGSPASGQLNLTNDVGLGFSGSFTLTYTVQVDFALAPFGATTIINKATVGMTDAGLGGSGTQDVLAVTATAGTGSGSGTSVDNAGLTSTGIINGLAATTLNVTDTFTLSASTVTNIQNTFFQVNSASPEPVSMLLFGSGLLGVALIGRKKLRRN